MKVDEYRVLMEAVNEGVAYGLSRAFKHDDSPSADAIRDQVVSAVMCEINEWFRFGDEVKD